jgi:hypothetical protein
VHREALPTELHQLSVAGFASNSEYDVGDTRSFAAGYGGVDNRRVLPEYAFDVAGIHDVA